MSFVNIFINGKEYKATTNGGLSMRICYKQYLENAYC